MTQFVPSDSWKKISEWPKFIDISMGLNLNLPNCGGIAKLDLMLMLEMLSFHGSVCVDCKKSSLG